MNVLLLRVHNTQKFKENQTSLPPRLTFNRTKTLVVVIVYSHFTEFVFKLRLNIDDGWILTIKIKISLL